MSRWLAVVVFAGVLAACSKDEPPAAMDMGSGSGSLETAPRAAVGASAGTGAAGRTGFGEAACGENMVLCPLKGWMKANTAAAVNARDFPRLSAALERV